MLAVPRTEGQATVCCTFPATYLPTSLAPLSALFSLLHLYMIYLLGLSISSRRERLSRRTRTQLKFYIQVATGSIFKLY